LTPLTRAIIICLSGNTIKAFALAATEVIDVNFSYSARAIIGIAILLICALISNLRLLRDNAEKDFKFIGNDYITVFQKQFDAAKSELPDSGIIRFISSEGDIGVRNFYVTQYILAPVILTRTPGPETVVYVFPTGVDTSGGADATVYKAEDGTKIFDFHNGIRVAKLPEDKLQ
jgi:hypothetical protein